MEDRNETSFISSTNSRNNVCHHFLCNPYNYVPKIVESYDSVNYLQHKVSFGVSVDPMRVLIEILVYTSTLSQTSTFKLTQVKNLN